MKTYIIQGIKSCNPKVTTSPKNASGAQWNLLSTGSSHHKGELLSTSGEACWGHVGANSKGASLQFRPSRAVTFQTLSLFILSSATKRKRDENVLRGAQIVRSDDVQMEAPSSQICNDQSATKCVGESIIDEAVFVRTKRSTT